MENKIIYSGWKILHGTADCSIMGGSKGKGGGHGIRTLPGKSQVALGVLQISGTDPLEKQLDPSREFRTALVELR